ncbi:hypothetical protein DY000_02017568 [Brassica cretica]|uniref:Uncharacterized protein n=1 Tax=Brassica cretica TaxID=69181 RepID=A0ABQ7CU28_BRACR|nr:hypothetical protein DY000_02017568 [Brassica cretica]
MDHKQEKIASWNVAEIGSRTRSKSLVGQAEIVCREQKSGRELFSIGIEGSRQQGLSPRELGFESGTFSLGF